MIKAVFVDFDESLYSHKAAKIPDSAYSAILKAQENGVLVLLATGRALCELAYFDLRNIKFDGYILNNGQLILDRSHNTVWANYFEGKNKELIVHKFVTNEIPIMLSTDKLNFMNYVDEITKDAFNFIDSPLPDIKKYENEDFMMASIFFDANKEKEYISEFDDLTLTWWHNNSADIIPKGGSKMKGIRKYLSLNNINIDEIMGVGDGNNDIEMISKCGVGVAMGNSIKEVKDVADYITNDIDDNGLFNAFKQYKII